jgi:hypothetical protein
MDNLRSFHPALRFGALPLFIFMKHIGGFRGAVSGNQTDAFETKNREWQDPGKRMKKEKKDVDDHLSGLGKLIKALVERVLGKTA